MPNRRVKFKVKDKNIFVEGDNVFLTGEEWNGHSTQYNPYYLSAYRCEGNVVATFSGEDVCSVLWANGNTGSYSFSELTLSSEVEEEPPTRSVIRMTKSLFIGETEVLKRNSRMYVQGDYAHDEDGLVFIKIDNSLLPNKTFTIK